MREIEEYESAIANLEVELAEAEKLYESNPLPALKLGIRGIRENMFELQTTLRQERQRIAEEKACDSPLGRAIAALFRYEQYDYWDSEHMQTYITTVENTLAEHGAKIIYDQ